MNLKRSKINSGALGRPAYYGLNRRVAKALKVSETYVSTVRNGANKNPRVEKALVAEMARMDKEAVRAAQ